MLYQDSNQEMILEFEREKKILEYLQSIQTRDIPFAIRKEISDATGIDVKLIQTSLNDLLQKKFVYTVPNFSGTDLPGGKQITTLGKEALQTEYNPEWIKEQKKEKQEERDLREREVKASEGGHKWTKIGTIAAIIISVLALAFSILK